MIEVSKKRLKFLDDAKGLGMMMIVWMHIWGNNTFEFAPPRPSENVTLKHITVGRAAIATPPEPI